jgi:hypothetical protein
VDPTERESLIMARRGQGIFKQRVMHAERMCRITKVDNPAHLRASHCKPWRDSSNQDRLNGENGLLLTPTIDHLFDRGFISFENSGKLIVSPVADICSLWPYGDSYGRAGECGPIHGRTKILPGLPPELGTAAGTKGIALPRRRYQPRVLV